MATTVYDASDLIADDALAEEVHVRPFSRRRLQNVAWLIKFSAG